MTLSGMWVLSLLFFFEICMETQSMQYHEPVNMDDLYSMFNDDGCIEGSLSITEMGTPLINQFSFPNPSFVTSHTKTLLDVKSPLSFIAELATFNNIRYMYNLEEEQGPPHKKKFGVFLELGSEKYFGEGKSIKEAQTEASKLALNSTSYAHPPEKPVKEKANNVVQTPVDRVLKLAEKLNIPVAYQYNEPTPTLEDEHDTSHTLEKYSKQYNVPSVTVQIGAQEFIGEGKTIEIAKEKASIQAIKHLQDLDSFCGLYKNEINSNLINKVFSQDHQNDSPVSILHEFSSKSNMKVLFELIAEEGPAHIKNFIYKCSLEGKFETTGEGSNKKTAKAEAAKKMLDNLKSLVPFSINECKGISRKKRSNKRSHLVKNVKKMLDYDESSEINIPDNIDPISKLIQIQQAKHDILPTFIMKEENGQANNREFFIEVFVGDHSYIGSGPNKKLAKRKAAEGMLELLGYSTMNGKTRLASSAKKKKTFGRNRNMLKRKPILSGLNIGPTYFENEEFLNNQPDNMPNDPVQEDIKDDVSLKNVDDKVDTFSSKNHIKGDTPKQEKTEKKSGVDQKSKLEKLSQQLGFKFQYSDFPKMKDSGFVSLLSLTTSPSRICYGEGPSTDISQNQAAISAINNIFKNEFDAISKIFRAQPSPDIKDLHVDDDNIINTIFIQET